MATSIQSVSGINEDLIPIQIPVDNKMYKLLVKQSAIPLISNHRSLIEDQLKNALPTDPPADPVYVDVAVAPPLEDKPTPGPTVDVVAPNTSSPPAIGSNPSSTSTLQEECAGPSECRKTQRLEWTVEGTKKMLMIMKDEKDTFEKADNKKSAWVKIAKLVGKATPDQCRERYYTLKKNYRKFLSESQQTGNRRPKPFIYEQLMADVVTDDPCFSPPVARGSLSHLNKRPRSVSDSDSDDGAANKETEEPTPKKPKKKPSKIDELKEYFTERDNTFLAALKEMSDKQNSLMEKLIEKL